MWQDTSTDVKRPTKVYRNGSGLVVTLPSDWLRGLGIRAGEVLEMEYTDSSVTVRRPLPDPPALSPVRKLLDKTRVF